MEITTVRLTDLKKAEKNIRKHTPKQIAEYVRSLKMFGQVRPIVADEDHVIIAGNGMYDALLEMGAETAECYIVTGMTENQKKKLMLADNKIYELGYNDIEAFDSIIAELAGDVDIPGWDEDLLNMLNSTAQQATAELESYGTFSEEDVSTIQSRKESSTPVKADTAGEGASTPRAETAPAPSSEEAAEEAPAEKPAEEEEDGRKFVICPHCGKKVYIDAG